MVLREAPSIEPHGSPARAVDGDTARTLERRAFLTSTPATLAFFGTALLFLTLTAGIVTATTVHSRHATLETMLAETEPLANSAQNLYSALSVADAAAATAFISGGLEPAEVRDRYTQSIGVASSELVYAAGGLDPTDADSRRLLSSISTDLTVYAGLIETARANNRTGHPVGSAYLSEASTLMQAGLLPMAQELHAQQEARVEATQRDFSRPPWAAIVTLGLTLGVLLIGQLLMAQRTRRTLNLGLILASVAIAVQLAWLLIAGFVSSMAAQQALTHGARPMHDLTASRILAQQARSEETLKLARRDSTGGHDESVDNRFEALRSVLDTYPQADKVSTAIEEVDRADAALELWVAAHRRMDEDLSRGDFEKAAAIAVGTGPQDSSTQFAELDDALIDGIIDARTSLRSNVSHASYALTALMEGALILTMIAFAGIIIGLWPRLREYQ